MYACTSHKIAKMADITCWMSLSQLKYQLKYEITFSTIVKEHE